jgi:hypothetical protein
MAIVGRADWPRNRDCDDGSAVEPADREQASDLARSLSNTSEPDTGRGAWGNSYAIVLDRHDRSRAAKSQVDRYAPCAAVSRGVSERFLSNAVQSTFDLAGQQSAWTFSDNCGLDTGAPSSPPLLPATALFLSNR